MADPFTYWREREALHPHRAGVLIEGTASGEPRINAQFLHLCLAWEASGAQWEMPAGQPPDSEQGFWLWLWEGCTVTEDEPDTFELLLDACGMAFEDARILFRKARNNRLIYPDGTCVAHIRDVAARTFAELILPKGLKGKV